MLVYEVLTSRCHNDVMQRNTICDD